MEDDERLLASLVLLLRLPPGAGDAPAGENIGEAAAKGEGYRGASSPLQQAWEGNDGELVCFAARLVRHYANLAEGGPSSAGCAYLRLAARVAFMRYMGGPPGGVPGRPYGAPLHLNEGGGSETPHNGLQGGDRLWECEHGLLASFLSALRARASGKTEEVDVEMAWAAQRLAVRLSDCSDAHCVLDGKLSHVWTETIDAMVARRQEKRGGVPSRAKTSRGGEATSAANDEQLMVQTLNAILDGEPSPEGRGGDADQSEDWGRQYDSSLVSCVQAYLQMSLHARQSGNALWSQRALFGMMRWSQQNHALSVDVYRLALQYLRLCSIRIGSRDPALENRHLGKYYSSCVAQGDGAETAFLEKTEAFATAIRSFVFYGLVVLSHAVPSRDEAGAQGHASESTLQIPPSTELRGDIFSLILDLWQLCGPDWLMLPPSNTVGTAAFDWWWLPSGEEGKEHRLGPTWPLCALVRLAAGEFRLSLGRFVAATEREEAPKGGDSASLSSGIEACAGLVAEATRLMTSIAEDEDCMSTWSPDAILHIRQSLEDALNSSVQYFNSLSEEAMQQCGSGRDEVGRSCCLIMGAIAAELEVDHLLAPPSSDDSSSADNERGSCFPTALQTAIRFCDSLGERLLPRFGEYLGTMSYEHQEPLACLLPCIMSLVSAAASSQQGEGNASKDMLQFALTTLRQENCLIFALSRLLRRAETQWSKCTGGEPNAPAESIQTIISVAKLCAMIVDEYTQIIPKNSSDELKEVKRRLSLWEKKK